MSVEAEMGFADLGRHRVKLGSWVREDVCKSRNGLRGPGRRRVSLHNVYLLPKSQIIWDLGCQNAQITSIWDLGFGISAKNTNYNLGFGILAFGISVFGFRIWAAGIAQCSEDKLLISTSSRKRSGRPKNEVWQHFNTIPTDSTNEKKDLHSEAACKFCKQK
ncbi:hypothetical protein Glove_88g110 [Diversispora epigaea]|uniref:Uncharacterized protein n=1 Tax=Diversispora epigaea TaxID=1348612 RepID=A0A397JFI8_9GLOM|nr:hypothetical protein Glove_88g110 [Diversispora epigaea]